VINISSRYLFPIALLFSLVVVTLPAQSALVPQSELPQFDRHCPGENDRAVSVEWLEGRLAGYGSLVCLDEVEQTTQNLFFAPDGALLTAEQFLEATKPPEGIFDDRMLSLLNDPQAPINLDPSAVQHVFLSLNVPTPQLPITAHTGSSTAGGPGDPIIFTINGEIVTEEEVIAFNQFLLEENIRNNALRLEIMTPQRRAAVEQLIEINGWHGRIDIEAFLAEDTNSVGIFLTREEILFMRDTSEALIVRAIPENVSGEAMNDADDGFLPGDFVPSNTAAIVAPTVTGNTISWPDNGWYQVQQLNQDAINNINVCEGGPSCVVPQGEYIVINHTTGERFTGIRVLAMNTPLQPINPASSIVAPPTNLRLVVYSATAAELFWERQVNLFRNATVQILRNGTFIGATQGTSFFDDTRESGVLYRYEVFAFGPADGQSESAFVADEGIDDPAQSDDPGSIVVTGNTISFPNDGWYQVQAAGTFESLCEGGATCQAQPGNYIVINHTTGERFENVIVGISSESINVSGNTISWPDDGWYQVQQANTFESVCNGGTSCEVGAGSYIVINHSTGERFENVEVEPASNNDEFEGRWVLTGYTLDDGTEKSVPDDIQNEGAIGILVSSNAILGVQHALCGSYQITYQLDNGVLTTFDPVSPEFGCDAFFADPDNAERSDLLRRTFLNSQTMITLSDNSLVVSTVQNELLLFER